MTIDNDVPPTAARRPGASDVRHRRAATVRSLTSHGFLDEDQPLCAVFDLDTADDLISSLTDAYPAAVRPLHTVAAKSVAVPGILRHFAEAGLGCEVASPGELRIALAAGFSADRIIYDSPAKSWHELRTALGRGVSFNIDNFEELDRVDRLMADKGIRDGGVPPIGIRINPQSGAGSIEAMSTATAHSKFGIGLEDFRDRLIEACAARPWITQLHVHSGSQGLPLHHTAGDVARVVALAEDIERVVGDQQIVRIDVGGGLSVNFSSDETTPTFADHAAALHRTAPELFNGKYRMVTEFGRSLTAKAGFLIGRVEYVKEAGPRRIAVTHIGVQIATRTVFMPDSWPLRIEVFTADGEEKTGGQGMDRYDIAGPACFAGDVIATQRPLPEVQAGDLIVVPDTGGYYASNHFGYNSLTRPAVYATQMSSGHRTFRLARRAQTLEQVVRESGELVLRDVACADVSV